MSDDVTTVTKLYDALADRDGAALLDALDEGFVGIVSDGMPLDVGGRHEGRDAMLRDCWGPVFAAYEATPRVDRYLACADGEVVALGRYVGHERESGRPLDAAFAHVLTTRDGRVASLEQITDTRRWIEVTSG